MKFEYKVHYVSGLKGRFVYEGPVEEDKIENILNRYATDGWEYQNTIVNPYVTDGGEYLSPSFYLVFRRANP